MKNQMTITVEPADPEMLRQMVLYRRNSIWASDHWMLFGEHRGQYVAVAQGEMFVAASHQEAKQLAQAKYPDDVPFVSYIPSSKREFVTVPGKPPTFLPRRIAIPFAGEIGLPVIEREKEHR